MYAKVFWRELSSVSVCSPSTTLLLHSLLSFLPSLHLARCVRTSVHAHAREIYFSVILLILQSAMALACSSPAARKRVVCLERMREREREASMNFQLNDIIEKEIFNYFLRLKLVFLIYFFKHFFNLFIYLFFNTSHWISFQLLAATFSNSVVEAYVISLLPSYLSIYLSIYRVRLFIYLSIYLSIYLKSSIYYAYAIQNARTHTHTHTCAFFSISSEISVT